MQIIHYSKPGVRESVITPRGLFSSFFFVVGDLPKSRVSIHYLDIRKARVPYQPFAVWEPIDDGVGPTSTDKDGRRKQD